jgi:PhnB protein
MAELRLPEGYQTVMPYLIINNAIDFFEFTSNVFGAKEKARHLNDDGSLMHGEVTIGGSTIMFGNASDQWPAQNAGLYIHVANADEVFQKALDNGATVYQPLSDQSYGRSGGVKDPFGNTWWITTPRQ